MRYFAYMPEVRQFIQFNVKPLIYFLLFEFQLTAAANGSNRDA